MQTRHAVRTKFPLSKARKSLQNADHHGQHRPPDAAALHVAGLYCGAWQDSVAGSLSPGGSIPLQPAELARVHNMEHQTRAEPIIVAMRKLHWQQIWWGHLLRERDRQIASSQAEIRLHKNIAPPSNL